jgi:hypothetical protein
MQIVKKETTLKTGTETNWILHSRDLGEFWLHSDICAYNLRCNHLRHDVNFGDTIAESSKTIRDDDEISDDPFVDVTPKNAMPALLPKTKAYLEDFENFIVK